MAGVTEVKFICMAVMQDVHLSYCSCYLHHLSNESLGQPYGIDPASSLMFCSSHHLLRLFIQDISIAPLQVHYYSEALPTQHGYCVGVSRRSATGNCE